MVNKNGSPQATDCLRLLKEKANKTGFDFVCLWVRTAGLLNAIQALYQLSYTPV